MDGWEALSPLATCRRGALVESVHAGAAVAVAPDGRVLFARGPAELLVCARSTLKPVQALPLVMSGLADAWPDAWLAIACASHAGEPEQVALVREILALAGLGEESLLCGAHPPYDGEAAIALVRAGRAPAPIHCNCSGKHAAMLALCKAEGWGGDYRDTAHPLQRRVRDALGALAGLDPAAIAWGVDGCGLPAFYLPLGALARVYACLATPDAAPPPYRRALGRLGTAMATNPGLVSGRGRLDTVLMAASGGRLVSKIGGEAIHAGGVRGQGIGWAIKVADGNKRALGPAIGRLLEAVGAPLPADPAVMTHTAPVVVNNHGDRVGRLESAF